MKKSHLLYSICGLLAVLLFGGVPVSAGGEDKKEAAGKANAEKPAAPGKVAVFKLSGMIPERASDELDLAALLGDSAGKMTHFQLQRRLNTAVADEGLKAVVFDLDRASLGLGRLQEMCAVIRRLREAGKDVWVFSETVTNGTMLAGSAATRHIVTPEGTVVFNGLYSQSLYFRNLLEKLHIEADILHIGDFKSAGEPFYRTGPSAESEAETGKILDSVFDQIVEHVARERRLTQEETRKLVDRGIMTARQARGAKLVDDVFYRSELAGKLRENYGKDVKFVHKYGAPKKDEMKIKSVFDLMKLMQPKKKKTGSKDAVAVVVMEGVIDRDSIQNARKAILKAAADERVKALVLRVNSPGGSALSSEVLCRATDDFKRSKKPFAVSMGNVAASGGYYIATQADRIFASPGTITGSIGVVGGKLATKGFFEWMGITTHSQQRGRHAGLFASGEKFTKHERSVVRKLMLNTYATFKRRVASGRKGRLAKKLDVLTGGRVFTGDQALKAGLVDELGGLNDAIAFAAGEAKLKPGYAVEMRPAPKSFFELLDEMSGEPKDGVDFLFGGGTGRVMGGGIPGLADIRAGIGALRTADPFMAEAAFEFLDNLRLLAAERVLLVSPPVRPGM